MLFNVLMPDYTLTNDKWPIWSPYYGGMNIAYIKPTGQTYKMLVHLDFYQRKHFLNETNGIILFANIIL